MGTSAIVANWRSFERELLSVLRIVAAFMFMQAGTMILFSWPAAMPGGATLTLASQLGVGGILEFLGGLLLFVGLFTRPVAFILAGEMAVAYFQFHFPQGFWPILNQGQPAVLYCFIWLYISSAGPGPWSIDAILRRR